MKPTTHPVKMLLTITPNRTMPISTGAGSFPSRFPPRPGGTSKAESSIRLWLMPRAPPYKQSYDDERHDRRWHAAPECRGDPHCWWAERQHGGYPVRHLDPEIVDQDAGQGQRGQSQERPPWQS